MPVIQVTLLPGYSPSAEERVVQRLADAVRSVIAAPASGTTVAIYHASTYMRDGRVFKAGAQNLPMERLLSRVFLI